MGTRRVTFEDLVRFRVVSDLRLSPDGQRLAFVVSQPDVAKDTYTAQIWLMDRGDGPRQLTAGPHDGSPRWSPDGRRLAFLAARGEDDDPQVHLLPLGGGEARPLTKGLKGASGLEWSAQGDRLAVTAWQAVPEEGLEDLLAALHWDNAREADRLAGKEPKALERDPAALYSESQAESGLRLTRRLKYRFDGVGYFDGRRRHLFLVDPSVDEPAEIEPLTGGSYDVGAFAWHPDGRRVAFLSNRGADADAGWRQDVWEVAVDGGATTELAHGAGSLWSLAWSPDGSTLAAIGDDGRFGIATQHALLVADGKGGLVNVTADFDRAVGSTVYSDLTGFISGQPLWTADGSRVLFTAEEHGSAGIYAATMHGTGAAQVRRLTPADWIGAPAEIAIAGGRIVAVASTPTDPPEIWELDESTGAWAAISAFNRALAEEFDLVPAEPLHFTGPDGWEIEGWLMRPPSGGDAPTPLVLDIHGGPHGSNGLGFSHQWQAYASSGRAVLFINPRGSSGYGQAFAKACINDWGGKDFEDLMAGVDAAIAAGGIDPKRLVVTGISYGGFMTSWVIGHTDRFACAIPEMVVSNLTSFYGTADIGTWFVHEEVDGDPYAGMTNAWRHSPVAYLDRCTTPSLVIEGEADWRCPVEQGEQVFAALRKRGVESALVRVPNASHVFSIIGTPSQRLRRQRVMAAWMDRYAKA